MNRKTFFRILVLLLVFLIFGVIFGSSVYFLFGTNVLENLQSDGSFVSQMIDFVLGVPEEVRELRQREFPDRDPGHQEYYYRQLDEDERKAYREMLEGIRSRRTEFYLTITGVDKINRVAHALYNDHPELYWVHNREKSYSTTYEKRDYSLYSPGYTYTLQEMAEINSRIEGCFQEVCSMLPENPSDYDISKTVYEYLIDITEYKDTEHDQNIAGVFWQKEAVCAGYARAAMYLLERLDVPCIFVEGDAVEEKERHAWNIITLDGENYYMDVTNGDQPDFLVGEATQLLEHKTRVMDYLCPYPEEYEQMYVEADDFDLPVCTAHDMNFYVLNHSVVDPYDWQAAYDLCCYRIQNGAAVIRFRVNSEEAFQEAKTDWIDMEDSRELSQYYMQENGIEYVEYYCGTLDYFKTLYFIF